jgi:hypothetical protein
MYQAAPDFERDTANGSIRFNEWLGCSCCVLVIQSGKLAPESPAEMAGITHFRLHRRARVMVRSGSR